MIKFADTHIHLQSFTNETPQDVIKKAIDFGVNKFICAGLEVSDWQKIADLYEIYPQHIVPAFGVHPWYVKQASSLWAEKLEEMLIKYPNALVGETGLDRYRDEDEEPQNSFFAEHIRIAKKYNRPMLIHAVRCPLWLDKYWNILLEKFVFHSYNARRQMLQKIISCGGYVSFSDSILRNREKEKTLRAVPKDRLMLETDAPYQAYEPYQLADLAEQIAQIREENYQDFVNQTYLNSQEFIKIGK